MIDLRLFAARLAINLDYVKPVRAVPPILASPCVESPPEISELLLVDASQASLLRTLLHMLLHLDEHHGVGLAVVRHDVDFKSPVVDAGANVPVDYHVTLEP